MKHKYKKESGNFILPADTKISSAPILSEIFVEAQQCPEEKIIIDASKVYWVSPFTACWFAALKDDLLARQKQLDVIQPVKENAIHQFKGLGIERYLADESSYQASGNLSTFPVKRLIERKKIAS